MTNSSFQSALESSKSILILLPTNPYFDQVAAGLSLFLTLKEEKEDRQVSIACPSQILVEFNRLVGVNKITDQLGEKNLTIKFVNYPAEAVERVKADIEGSTFYLTVVPKPGKTAPQKEQIELTHSGLAADTIIAIGGVNDNHFPSLVSEELSSLKLVHIGTKELNLKDKKDIISFARPAVAISEIVYSLIKESNLKVDRDIATNLLMGIEEASKQFSDPTMTAESFEIIAQLIRQGGTRIPKQQEQPDQFRQQPFLQPAQGPRPMPLVQPQNQQQPPKSWLEPKIYKGASLS